MRPLSGLAAVCALALVLPLTACKKPSVKTCDKACRNASVLLFWETADAEIAAAPEAERAALRAQKEAEYQTGFERGIDLCITQCQSADNDDQNTCLIKAKTAADIHACTKK
ncbi:MAG: hypothetical protein H6708_10745 [Kofleriaceae bacterium]|nr:hypothetical protein [Kofleriaceae bacterium]